MFRDFIRFRSGQGVSACAPGVVPLSYQGTQKGAKMIMKLTSVRISEDAHTRAYELAEYVGRLQDRNATRSDVLRLAIRRGLELLENEKAGGSANATA